MVNSILMLLSFLVGAVILAIVVWKLFVLVCAILADVAGLIFSIIVVFIVSFIVMAIL